MQISKTLLAPGLLLAAAVTACVANRTPVDSSQTGNDVVSPTQPASITSAGTTTGSAASSTSPSPSINPNLAANSNSTGDGEYVIGPTYANAPELTVNKSVPQGVVNHFTMDSTKSAFYTGLDSSLTTPATFNRDVWVYVPAQYVKGAEVPFMIVQDGGSYMEMATVCDNLIAAKKLPVMVVILINPGPGDGRGSERGLEYDTVSDTYVSFVEKEVLPEVESNYGVKFTTDPDGRGAMGGSSGGAAAFTMAWYRSDLYHRVLTYSGTFVNQHPDATFPHGAWEYHEHLLLDVPAEPLRVFIECGQNDNDLETAFGDGYHSWRSANERMAVALHAQKYHYRFEYGLAAGHVDGGVVGQTLPEAMQWVWQNYPIQ